MNTQCNGVVSVTGSKVHLTTLSYPRSSGMSRCRRIDFDHRLNAAAFEQFLYRLGPDPETAGRKYELIRTRLIMMFRARRCVFAEDLADATFERVMQKLTDLTVELTGDSTQYFYGVAQKIYLEHQRKLSTVRWKSAAYSLETNTYNRADTDDELENRLQQLDEALSTIPKSDRELILGYYTGTGPSKINHRRALAKQLGGTNALRLRVFRIRREIKNYMSLNSNAMH
jgi:DNA-directed RNA polymerase specialized sigma24 family protein